MDADDTFSLLGCWAGTVIIQLAHYVGSDYVLLRRYTVAVRGGRSGGRMYYINTGTNEVHRRRACSWQDTIGEWVYLGSFSSMVGALSNARATGYPNATQCEHCVS